MTSQKFRAALLTLVAVLLAISIRGVGADEGFWPFTLVPRDAIRERYGFEVTDTWLRDLQLASVRFNNGGSGSFVSADGLVLTNHHVGFDTVSKLSTPGRDLAAEGYLARTRQEELKAPDLELNVLVGIEDVTARVNAAVGPAMSAQEALEARRAAIAAIEEESLRQTGLRSDVVTLYQGGQYHLHRYRQYTDVRLVWAPEADVAFFGGDPDNFTFPRYCLDAALFRVYEDDRPARTEHYVRWARDGVRDGEPVFVSGHPGSTQRLNTVAHLEFLRDEGLPAILSFLEHLQASLATYGARGAEAERQARDELFSVDNALKAFRGQLAGLRDAGLMSDKRDAERDLRAAVDGDDRLREQYGEAWEAIARARSALPSYNRERVLLENAWGFQSRLFQIARTLVRLAEESGKPNAERLPEYTDARRGSIEVGLFSEAPIYAELEEAKLAESLAFLQRELRGHPLLDVIFEGRTPAAAAAALVRGTQLADVEVRRRLAEGGRAAIQASDDPMIRLANAVDPAARAVRRRYEQEVISVERDAYGRIAQAIFALRGTSVYPDATFTLRLSYGAVAGYQEDGRRIPPFTQLGGLFERAGQFAHEPPYALPERWMALRDGLDLQTPFNFVSTVDIIGGNSGSPVVNRRGELVGLIFDGNIHSLVGEFLYDESMNRAVAVDTRAIVEALAKVYAADWLLEEMGMTPAVARRETLHR